MPHIKTQLIKTPLGDLILGSYEDKLCLCDWLNRKDRAQVDNRIKNALKAEYANESSEIIEQTKQQLTEYFQGNRKNFQIPLLTTGTEFQTKVWQALTTIPYGKTTTYQQIANQINNPKSPRAAAQAIGANAIAILIPCHRVIGKDGSLTGYAGGIICKKGLLGIENAATQHSK